MVLVEASGDRRCKRTIDCGSRTGRNCRTIMLNRLKAVTLTPMPTASTRIAVSEKPGERRSVRAA